MLSLRGHIDYRNREPGVQRQEEQAERERRSDPPADPWASEVIVFGNTAVSPQLRAMTSSHRAELGRDPETGQPPGKAPVAAARDPSRPSSPPDHPGESRDRNRPEWCPHCGGPLGRRPQLFQHPCFDDTAWAIRKMDEGSASSAAAPSSVIRPQPGAWRLLCALRAAFGHFVSRYYLLAQVQPRKGEDADPKIVEVYLCHLRKALQGTPFLIESRRGTGCWRLIQKSVNGDR
jgi:hypothetical protein